MRRFVYSGTTDRDHPQGGTTACLATGKDYYLEGIIGGNCQKYHFCRDKTFVYVFLSRQTYACRDKDIFVATNICREKHNFVATKQAFVATKIFYRDKSFVAANIIVSRQKACFVPTNTCLSRQKYFDCDKSFVAANIIVSRQKACFVPTNTCLLRQTCVCFVATKMILAAAPASDTKEHPLLSDQKIPPVEDQAFVVQQAKTNQPLLSE